MPTTPNRGYPWPVTTDEATVPDDLAGFLGPIDADMQTALDRQDDVDVAVSGIRETAEAAEQTADAVEQSVEVFKVDTQEQLDTRFGAIATAYDVAVAQGYSGTVGAWLDSLVGPRGPEGPYGGTAVADPQIASYVGDVSTETGLEIAESTTPQVDYVALLSGLASYDRMTVTKTDQWNSLAVRCSSPAGGYVQYAITNGLNYQYVAEVATLDPASTGPAEGDVVTTSFTSPELTLTNFSWTGATTTPYTMQVGAIWTCEVTTTTSNARVTFRAWTDDRGGLWRLSVDGTALQADVSVWAATTGSIDVEALTIPTPGTYTIRGEFLGDDPANPPTGTARGWTKGVNSTDGNATIQIIENGSAVPVEHEISPRSNKDFAIRLKPFDAAASEFVPRHGTDSEAFASPTRYLNGGAPLDVEAMSVGESVEVESFEWVQHIWGRNSNTGSRNIAEVWTTQRITPDGVFHVAGRWKTLEDLEAGGRVYHLMMMGSRPLFDEAVSSLSGSYALDRPLGQGNWFTDEGNLADSWALLSYTSSAVASVRYDNRRESLRTGQEDTPARGNQTFIELRTDGTQAKVYPPIYDVGVTIPAGRVHRFSGAYFYGSVPGARESLSLQ